MLVSTVPEKREKEFIRKRYFYASLAVFADLFIFQGLSRILLVIVGLANGSSLSEAYYSGSGILSENEALSTFYSIGFPILGGIVAIVIGFKGLHLDFKKMWGRENYDIKDISGGFAVSLLLQLAASIIISVIYALITGDSSGATSATITQRSAFWVNIILYTYVCILGPIMEEMIFRGIVLESIRPYNEKFAIFFSALIFGLMHGNLAQALNGFLIGLVLGTLYAKSKSLLPSSLVHMAMNTVTTLLTVMMYSDSDIIDKLLSGDIMSLTGMSKAGIALNVLIRIVSLIAGIIVLIVDYGNGYGIRRVKESGKKRAAPLVWTNPLWIIVILCYVIIIVISF